MRSLRLDWHKFTPLQRVLCLIDMVLNPKATTWPCIYTDLSNRSDAYTLPKGHVAITAKSDSVEYTAWCIRWL